MMESLKDWMLKTIREENSKGVMSGWLEEELYKWTPLVSSTLHSLLNGVSFIVLTDTPRAWLRTYILQNINHPSKNRPYIPFVGMDNLDVLLGQEMRSTDNLKLAEGMLDLVYRDYAFFYIGRREGLRAELALGNENSFLWLLDESLSNAFTLESFNPMLDFRLLQLYKIFDQTLSAMIAGKISLGA